MDPAPADGGVLASVQADLTTLALAVRQYARTARILADGLPAGHARRAAARLRTAADAWADGGRCFVGDFSDLALTWPGATGVALSAPPSAPNPRKARLSHAEAQPVCRKTLTLLERLQVAAVDCARASRALWGRRDALAALYPRYARIRWDEWPSSRSMALRAAHCTAYDRIASDFCARIVAPREDDEWSRCVDLALLRGRIPAPLWRIVRTFAVTMERPSPPASLSQLLAAGGRSSS